MKLTIQFAIDTTDHADAIFMADQAVKVNIDILEVGTPAIITYGLGIVKEFHARYPNILLYADIKMIDFARTVGEAFSAGVSFVTVMVNASNDHISEALQMANRHNGDIVFSSMGYPSSCLLKRINELIALGGKNFVAHGTASTMDLAFRDLIEKAETMKNINNINTILAGGINRANLLQLVPFDPKWIIVGRGISSSGDIQNEILALRKILTS